MPDRKPTDFADPELEDQRRQTLAELESLHGTRAIGAEEYRQRAEVARRAQDEHELLAVRPTATEHSQGRTRPGEPARAAASAPGAQASSPSRPASHGPGSSYEPDSAYEPDPPYLPVAEAPAGEDVETVFAVLGAATRKGPWEPPETLHAYAFLGGVDLDFRQAALLEGVTEVKATTVLGGINIILPEDVDVEVNGIAILGGFDHVSQHLPGSDRPLIRISGLAVLGAVEVKVKPMPGEGTIERLKRRVRDLV